MTKHQEAMQRHYDHYRVLAETGKLSPFDEPQWRLAQERKKKGLVRDDQSGAFEGVLMAYGSRTCHKCGVELDSHSRHPGHVQQERNKFND